MKTIYFGNLPNGVNKSVLIYIIKNFGRGYNIRIIPSTDPNALQYGFAEMTDSEADALLEYSRTHTITCMDTRIKIKPAKGEISERSARINEYKKEKEQAKIKRKQKIKSSHISSKE